MAAPVAATLPVVATEAEAPVAESPGTPIPEGIAAKLMRIRNAVANAQTEPRPAPTTRPETGYSEDQHAESDDSIEDAEILGFDPLGIVALPPDTVDAGTGPGVACPGAAFADPACPDTAYPDAAFADDDTALLAALATAEAPLPDDPAEGPPAGNADALPESLLAALAADAEAAPAGEARAAPQAAPLGDFIEDLPEAQPERFAAAPAADLADLLPETVQADDEDSRAADDAALMATLGQLIDPEDRDDPAVAQPAADLPSVASVEPDGESADLPDGAQPEPAQPEPALPVTAPVEPDDTFGALMAAMDLPSAAPAPAPAEGPAAAAAETTATPPAQAVAPQSAAETVDDKPALSEKALRARARVIKIRRSDAAPAAGPGAGQVAGPAGDQPPAAESAADLSPEAEADLLRELAELEQEAGITAPEPTGARRPVTPVHPTSARALAEGRGRLDPATGDAAVSRLIEQTNTEMAGPENRRRLSAIAHLKAAVAATVAERRIGRRPEPSETDRIDPYRNDLARAVRPHRSDVERPAPLVLVSEQRIDRVAPQAAPAAEQIAPVRPRRVTAAGSLAVQDMIDEEDPVADEDTDNIFEDSRGFVEFAERLGASGLPDLLEAAAAYSACVEGRPHFSRPQLMRHVNAMAPEGGFARETGLRSFGTLLRNGKIEKVKRGQFALSESSRFMAEARKITR
ncbi:hypothetical protein RNZ50_17270 [Paracoccaceae bacterium Fryx2]|nr:hypothetical protein [Paracoccaceae bacterium Fryx2]